MSATLSPMETVFELAEAEVDRLEQTADPDSPDWSDVQARCNSHRAAIALARAASGNGPAYSTTIEPEQADLDRVNNDPKNEHRVGTFPSNERAFRCRRRWTAQGFLARTQKLADGEHAVFAKVDW